MNDENKTPLTHRVTALAAAYLDGGGFKPVESEVTVRAGWIADLASFLYPSQTECRNLKLLPRFTETKEHELYSELYYRHNWPITALVEVKTSRADFAKDLKTKFAGLLYPAHLCYLAYPKSMLNEDEIPVGWIGIETTTEADRIWRVHPNTWSFHRGKRRRCFSSLHAVATGDVMDLIAQVAIRRDHRTRYVAQRALVKAMRSRDKEYVKQRRSTETIAVLASWFKGDSWLKDRSLLETLESHGIKVSDRLKETVAWLETLREKKHDKS